MSTELRPVGDRQQTLSFARPSWPLGIGVDAAALVAIVLATFLAAWHGTGTYVWWVSVSASLHDSLIVSGPIVALWAAHVGFSVARRDSVFHGAAVAHRSRQFARHVGALSAATVLAVMLGALPMLGRAVRTATWGGPSVFDVMELVAGALLIVAVFFTFGSLLPRAELIVLAPVLTVAYVLSPTAVDRALAVTGPAWSWSPNVRFEVNPNVVLYFVAFAGVVAVGCWSVFIHRGPQGQLRRVGPVAVCTAVLVAVPFVWRPDLYVLRHDPKPVCMADLTVPVCVHPANVTQLDMVVEASDGVFAVAGTSSITKVLDFASLDSLPAPPGVVDINLTNSTTPADVRFALVESIFGPDRCGARFADGVVPDGDIGFDAAEALEARVLALTGHPDEASTQSDLSQGSAPWQLVSGMGAPEIQRVLRDHAGAVATCSLSVSDLR